MEGKRAVGVRYEQNGVVHEAKARREVLLCGGAINSPQLLQLSGIGPGGLLQSVGIPVVHDLPGVGENLQDHIGGRMIYRCIDGTVTMNEIYHNWLRRLYAGAEWILARKGPLMTGAGPMGLFVKTRPELDSPDVQYQFLAGSAEKTGDPMHRFPACTMVAIPCRPESRGWLRITSGDPRRPPAMQPNYLSTQRDKDTIVAGLRVIRKIFATEAMRRWTTEEYMPGPHATTDEDLLNHVRATSGTTFHQTSTCMMGPGPMAVVDTELRVKGTQGLRVIDAAVMPTVVSGNTNATVIMIAEKGADMILAEANCARRPERSGLGELRLQLLRQAAIDPFDVAFVNRRTWRLPTAVTGRCSVWCRRNCSRCPGRCPAPRRSFLMQTECCRPE